MRNNRTAQHKQSSGWWVLVLIVGLAIAYAVGGMLGPLIFKKPAPRKTKLATPSTAPSKLPLSSVKPPSRLPKPDKKPSGGDVEVEVIVNKPAKSNTSTLPKPKTSEEPAKRARVAEPGDAPRPPKPKVVEPPKSAEPVTVPKRSLVKKTEPAPVVKPPVKPTAKPTVKPVLKPAERAKPVPEKPDTGLPVQQPTRLDDQTKLPPVTPAAGVYRVMANAQYKSWTEAQAGLVQIKNHVPGASIIKSSKGGYVVQLAQYRVKQNVSKFTSELKQRGIPYIVR